MKKKDYHLKKISYCPSCNGPCYKECAFCNLENKGKKYCLECCSWVKPVRAGQGKKFRAKIKAYKRKIGRKLPSSYSKKEERAK